jgi:hypothetical protein
VKKPGIDFVSLNFDEVWVAISKSKKFNDFCETVAKEVENEATSMAKNEAIDEGYYSDLFSSGVMSANKLRKIFQYAKNNTSNRKALGTYGKNRFFDKPMTEGAKVDKTTGDVYGKDYSGAVGVVINDDYKAVWVEYGSMAKGPRFILTRAAERIAKNYGFVFDRIYVKSHEQNLPELGKRIGDGRHKAAESRKGGAV